MVSPAQVANTWKGFEMFWLGFLMGVFVGTCLGALLIAICTAAAMADYERHDFPHQSGESDNDVDT